MSNRGRQAYYRAIGSAGQGGGRGSPDFVDHPPLVRGGGGWVHYPRGGPTRGRGRGSPGTIAPEPHGQQANIDERIADDSDKALVASFRSAHDVIDSLPLRPDFGMDGTRIALHTNFFPVRVPRGPMYEYYIIMVPAGITYSVRRRVLQLAEQTATWRQSGMHGNVAHDNDARLVSVVQLPQPLAVPVTWYNEGETGPPEQGGRVYTLSIYFIQEITTSQLASYLAGESSYRNHNALPVIATLTTILASISNKVDVRIGKRYFSPATAEQTGLGRGLEAWRGFQSTLTPVYNQLMVRVGISTGLFISGNLAHAMADLEEFSFGARMSSLLRGLRIKTHLGHRKIVKRIVPQSARAYSIDNPEYGRVTLEDYFRQKYSLRLQYHDMPLVDVSGFHALPANYLPAEVCDILPSRIFRKGPPGEHAATVTATSRRPPKANRMAIVNYVRNQLALDMTRPELRSFGMTIGHDMAVVPGRILPTPGIEYSSGTALIDDRASWNLRGVKFAVGARLENWAVLVIKDGFQNEFTGAEDEDLRWVVTRFCNMCNASGMHVIDDPKYVTARLPHEDPPDPLRHPAIEAIGNALLTVNPKPTLFLVTLANEDKAIYEGLKHLCDVFLDVATVCVQSRKFRKSHPHYLANVALKVNMKLGGINHKLDPNSGAWLNCAPTMVVGIHVTHPSPGSTLRTPSVVAVVANVDDNFAQYPVKLGIQQSGVEVLELFETSSIYSMTYPHKIVTDIKNMMVDRLKLFQAENSGKLPERIIIYRSGVSESHSQHVISIELPQMLGAFSTFHAERGYRPKLAIIICGKRHQVRFYPTDMNGGGNPPPGTVVDRGTTTIYNFDFFLQSHDASSGTARPIHYHVIYDEIGFKADELQGVTNSLSYMFARATQSVRLVSPAYYAEIASRRGRCYLRKLYLGFGTAASLSDGEEVEGQDTMQEAAGLWGGGVSRGLKDTMFYL